MTIELGNVTRLLKYAVRSASVGVVQLAAVCGPRNAAAFIVRAGRMQDRMMGCGLPVCSIADVIRKLRGQDVFSVNLGADRLAMVSSDPIDGSPDLAISVIAAAANPRFALEIGTARGGGTCAIAMQLKNGNRVVTVGPPEEWIDPKKRPGGLTDRRFFDNLPGRFAWDGTPFVSRIDPIKADSRTLDYSRFGCKFDFVFIDGSHSYEAVKADTERVLPFVAEGGVIAWHDYGSSVLSHGVYKYLNEMSRREPWPIMAIEYTTLAIQIRRDKQKLRG